MSTGVVRYDGITLEVATLTYRSTGSSSLGEPLESEQHVLGVIALKELGENLFGDSSDRKGIVAVLALRPGGQAFLCLTTSAVIGPFFFGSNGIHGPRGIVDHQNSLPHGSTTPFDAFLVGRTTLQDQDTVVCAFLYLVLKALFHSRGTLGFKTLTVEARQCAFAGKQVVSFSVCTTDLDGIAEAIGFTGVTGLWTALVVVAVLPFATLAVVFAVYAGACFRVTGSAHILAIRI